MATDPTPRRKRWSHRLLDASAEPADLVSLARRRRLTHLVTLALLAIGIVALIFSPTNPDESNAGTLIGGLSFILLTVTLGVAIQYTVRIRRKRRTNPARASEPTDKLECPAGSAAYQPLQQLRSAARLLESVLPEIEQFRPGLTATAERTRLSLEHTAHLVLLEEQMLATLADGTHADDARNGQTRHNVTALTARLRSGADEYVKLTQQATLTATSLADVTGNRDLQDADEQLAGLSRGLHEVQQISPGAS